MARVSVVLCFARFLAHQVAGEPAPCPGTQPASFTYLSGRRAVTAKRSARGGCTSGRSAHRGVVG